MRKRKGDSREMEETEHKGGKKTMNKRERADERRPGLGREWRGVRAWVDEEEEAEEAKRHGGGGGGGGGGG